MAIMKRFGLSIFAIFYLSAVFGQTETINNIPHLNGHYFVTNSRTPHPFINSSISTNLGLAKSGEFATELFQLGGVSIVGLSGQLVFADLDVYYQQKIKDWVAFYTHAGLTARAGSGTQSIISQGLNTVSSIRIGWLIEILKKPKYMLSGNFQINNHSATFIDISQLVEDFDEDHSFDKDIYQVVPMFIGNVGLRFAYGMNDLIGCQLYAEGGYGESFKRGESNFTYRIGGLVDVNLYQHTDIPIGFLIYYNSTTIPDYVQVENKAASNYGFKLAYTGGAHFNFGLEVSKLRIPIPGASENVPGSSFILSSHYFFN